MRLKYRDFNKLGRNIIRALRRNPSAIVVYPSGFDIDRVIEYLTQHGYPANPRLDKSGQYFMDRDIYEINNSNVLMARVLRSPQAWS